VVDGRRSRAPGGRVRPRLRRGAVRWLSRPSRPPDGDDRPHLHRRPDGHAAERPGDRPVGLVAGDDALAAEVEDWLPWAERVVVKEGFGTSAAASLHPARARDLVRAGAARAVQRARAGELRRLEVGPPVVIEVDYRRALEADFAAVVPNAERLNDRTVRHAGPDPVTAYRGFLAGVRLAATVE